MSIRPTRPWDPTPGEAAVTQGALALVTALDAQIAQLQAARAAAVGIVLDVALTQRERYEKIPVGETRSGEAVYDPDDLPIRSAVAEVSAATRASRRAVEREFNDVWMLTHTFPEVAAAFGRGEIDQARASAIVGEGYAVTDTVLRGEYERLVLPHAASKTVHGTRETARRIAANLEPESFAERHERARRTRGVNVRNLDDGMAELRLIDDAVVVHGAHDRITQMTRRITAARRKAAALSGTAATGSTDETTPDGASTGAPARCTACRDAPDPCDACARTATGDTGPSDTRLRCDTCVGKQTPCDDCLRTVAEIDALFAQAITDGLALADAGETGGVLAGLVTEDGQPITDERSFDQIRADVATSLLLIGDAADEHVLDPTGLSVLGAIQARVNITLPVTSLTGLDNEPADLTGYGPVAARVARRTAANAPSWARLFHHPDTGALLTVDRYAPTAEQRRYLRSRDGTCTFTHCDHLASNADIDHTHDHALGGSTVVTNLAHLCRRHHVLKHQSGWTSTLAPDGTVTWRSPAGNTHVVRPRAVVTFLDAADARAARGRTRRDTCKPAPG